MRIKAESLASHDFNTGHLRTLDNDVTDQVVIYLFDDADLENIAVLLYLFESTINETILVAAK